MQNLVWIKGYIGLFAVALTGLPELRRRPVREVFHRQVYYTGVQALWSVAALGAILGMVVITQLSTISGVNTALTGKIMVWAIVRELGPLFAAIIVIARSASAVAAELGSMNAGGEIGHLESMGISPMTYLIVPRVLGITLSALIVSFIFQVMTMFGGALMATSVMDVSFELQMSGIIEALDLGEVVFSLTKGLVFGLAIATVSCYHGMSVGQSISDVPKATTNAMMQCLLVVIISDALITGVWAL